MKADTYAKLQIFEALIEAEIGYFLEHSPESIELFREAMVSRVSDLVDEIDYLDSVAAARLYDAIVDFLTELPDDDLDGVVEATVHFRRAVDRLVERGFDRRDLKEPSTWAIVLDELLTELTNEYHRAVAASAELDPRAMKRADALLSRSRLASDRMLATAEEERPEIRNEMDRLVFAVRYRRRPATEVDLIVQDLQRRIARYRPAPLSSIGAFVIREVLGSDQARGRAGRRGRSPRTRRARTRNGGR